MKWLDVSSFLFCNKEQKSVPEDVVSHNCYFLCGISYVYAVII